jgi:hypothetical protein
VHVLGNGAVLIGMGERTTPMAVEILARALFGSGQASRVIAVLRSATTAPTTWLSRLASSLRAQRRDQHDAAQARHRGAHRARRETRPRGRGGPRCMTCPIQRDPAYRRDTPMNLSATDLHGRNLLKETDVTADEFMYLVGLAGKLRGDKRLGFQEHRLAGRNIALIFEKTSTRTRSAFEVAAHDEGGHVTFIGPGDSQLGREESVKDTARVLGRMFDGIEYRGFSQESAEILGRYAGVAVWNGLTEAWHPTQMLADILTMHDNFAPPLTEASFCYLGDGRNNTANSLLVTGALLGMDTRICAPAALQPAARVADVTAAVSGADFL